MSTTVTVDHTMVEPMVLYLQCKCSLWVSNMYFHESRLGNCIIVKETEKRSSSAFCKGGDVSFRTSLPNHFLFTVSHGIQFLKEMLVYGRETFLAAFYQAWKHSQTRPIPGRGSTYFKQYTRNPNWSYSLRPETRNERMKNGR